MALGYLLGAALQVEDTNGKPLTGGSIKVCHHGTSEPYITYRDFDGNRNPEYVPLNSDGMAVIIADDANAYDVYCYNRFGGDAWSRLNVTVGGGGGGGGGEVYYAGAGILIDSANTISVDPSVVQGTLTAGTNIDITEDVVSVNMTASSTSASSYREAVNSVSQSADGSVSASTRKVVGSEWTLAHTNSAGNKFLKIAEFPCYSGFRYVGSGYTNLVVKCSDSDDGRTYTVAVGLMQASNGNHNFSARLRAVVDYCRSSTQPIKSFYLFSDTEYGSNQSQATLSLWVEFDSFAYNSWTFEALVNTAVGGTGSDSHENAWEFANGKRYTVSALPTGGWQLNSMEPVSVNVPAVSSGDNGKVLGVTDSQGNIGWVSQPSFTQQQSNWTEANSSSVQYIQHKPTEKALVAGSNITITEGTNDITIAATNTTYSAGDGIGISSNVISRKVQFVTPSSTYSAIRHVLDEGDVPVLDVANGSYHNYFFPTHKSGTHVDFVGSMGYNTFPTYEAANYLLKYSVDNNNQWTVTKYHELPYYTSADANKVLQVNSSGNGVEWVLPQ